VIGEPPFGDADDEELLLVAPGSPDDSLMLRRVESTNPALVMPPVGRNTVDEEFAALLREWIEALSDLRE
jgi:hypothetical protein